jgi:hypothetical protein
MVTRPSATGVPVTHRRPEKGTRPGVFYKGAHQATLTRNQVRFSGTRTGMPVPAEPVSTQREAFDLTAPRSRSR